MKNLIAGILLLSPVSFVSASIVGYERGFYFYKNSFTSSSQIVSLAPDSQLQARYGFWDTEASLFSPYWPDFYPTDYSQDPYPITVFPFLDSTPVGEFMFTMYVHPFHPAIYPAETQFNLPFIPPPSATSKLGVEILYREMADLVLETYTSVVVFEAAGIGWLDSADTAEIGYLQTQDGGLAILLIPEPSSLSLLLAGGAVLMAGRRRRQDLGAG